MAKTTILVKYPGQPLCYMDVPTDKIDNISKSISGLHRADIEFFSLYGNFYYILMDRNRNKRHLPFNMTVFFMDSLGGTDSMDVCGPFVICKLPKGLLNPLSSITQGDAVEIQKLLQN